VLPPTLASLVALARLETEAKEDWEDLWLRLVGT
jgi:hypothetical protein